jgi:cytochrome c oxidase subunit II
MCAAPFKTMLNSLFARVAALCMGMPAVVPHAFAQAKDQVYGQPVPWQMDLQKPVTGVGEFIHTFHTGMVYLIVGICLFVLALMIYVCVRFREKANPVPSKTTHHVGVEIAWTVIPILILIVVSIPSFRLLKLQLEVPPADVTIKATGHAWYWNYQYPGDPANAANQGGFGFDSNMLKDNERRADQPRLLAVDNEVVVPVNKVVRVQVTAADVMHAFAMPAFGVKVDAVPGRLNEVWFKAEREGIYYGQCSELCGAYHAFMPIAIRVVNDAQYAEWIAASKKKFATNADAAQFAEVK